MSSADPPRPRPSEVLANPPTSDGEAVRWPGRPHGTLAQQLETCLNRAQAQIQMQRWHDARTSLDAALALDPHHLKARELRDLVQTRLNRRG